MRPCKKILSFALALMIAFVLCIPTMAVSAEASQALTAGSVTTRGSNLNVRKTASSSAKKVAKLKNGAVVTLVSQSGGWWYINYAPDAYGYVSADYITQDEASFEATVSTSGGNLNVRSGAGTSFSSVKKLKKGSKVVVLSESDGWSKILYNGNSVGYASSAYLKRTQPLQDDEHASDPQETVSDPQEPAGPEKILLDVPLYKQTDARWSSMKIGKSGKTVGKIGCALTCLAMTESYITGEEVLPSDMLEILRFNSSGSLYWPERYSQDHGENYLRTLRSQLRAGHPVLICGATKSGSTHYVVVTGYEENGSVSADDFYINDPSSKDREKLSDLFRNYPNFVKLVYYK